MPVGRNDRVNSVPGTDFQSMRRKARAGKLRGKQYSGDDYLNGLTTAQSVRQKSVAVVDTVGKTPIKSPRSNNDPSVPQFPLRDMGFKAETSS